MKKLLFNIFFLSFCVSTLMAHKSEALPVGNVVLKTEFTESIKKEFDINADGNVSLLNRYGKVDVKTWNENKVKAEITITVVAKSEENAQKVFDRIEVDFSNGADFVKAETTIGPESKSWSWWGNSSNSKFTIDYKIYMPASCDLELVNKYGHSFVEQLHGNANIDVKYGDIRLDGLENNLDLTIGYGNATIGKSKDARVNIKYGKLRMEETRDLNIESKYSKIYLDKAADIESLSKYDTYRLGEIRELQGNGKYDDFEIDYADIVNVNARYSDFNITQLSLKGDFDVEYGGVAVGLSSGFSKLEIESRYTGVKVGVKPGSNYNLDVLTRYAGIRYPSSLDVHRDIDQSNEHRLEGKAGSGGDSSIRIRSSYGSVKIFE